LFFLLKTHGCGTQASWAAQHTTVCLDLEHSQTCNNVCRQVLWSHLLQSNSLLRRPHYCSSWYLCSELLLLNCDVLIHLHCIMFMHNHITVGVDHSFIYGVCDMSQRTAIWSKLLLWQRILWTFLNHWPYITSDKCATGWLIHQPFLWQDEHVALVTNIQ